jgi:hypothetical protein
LRTEIIAEQADEFGAVRADAFFAAEEAAQDQRTRINELGEPQRNHRECCAAAFGRNRAEYNTEEETGHGAEYGHQHQRDRCATFDRPIHHMRGDEGGETIIDRMTER